MDGEDKIVRRVVRKRNVRSSTPTKSRTSSCGDVSSCRTQSISSNISPSPLHSKHDRNNSVNLTTACEKKDWGFTNSFASEADSCRQTSSLSCISDGAVSSRVLRSKQQNSNDRLKSSSPSPCSHKLYRSPVGKKARKARCSSSDELAKNRTPDTELPSEKKSDIFPGGDSAAIEKSVSQGKNASLLSSPCTRAYMSDTSFNESDLLAIAALEQEHYSQEETTVLDNKPEGNHTSPSSKLKGFSQSHQQSENQNSDIAQSKSNPKTRVSENIKDVLISSNPGDTEAKTGDIVSAASPIRRDVLSHAESPVSLHDKIINKLRNNVVTPTTTRAQRLREAHMQSILDEAKALHEKSPNKDLGPFYGLPTKVKELFESQRGITSLYDWQHECLSLGAIQNRQNLIYSLPTSGGKTLVAEILILREMLCQQKDALLILPFVSIVQEKVRSLASFALELDFLVEEYAASKGRIPPLKRRKHKSLFIATIEKADSLISSLIEQKRMDSVGLVVVDELHMLGEGGSRGATLEVSLSKIMCTSKTTHIVGMSATLSNIKDLQNFLNAEVYTNNFRPVELKEFVKIEDSIYEVDASALCPDDQIKLSRIVTFPYDKAALSNDPDHLAGLVSEVVPQHSCLLFCPTKKNCENVATLLCKMMPRDLTEIKKTERKALLQTLLNDGNGEICPVLQKTIAYGVAYHHSGLTMDERKLIEEAYSEGTLCLLTCTSTLAAGVNLPAKRVILRAPYVGASFLSKSQYKQMIGRAGRAGIDSSGQSILILKKADRLKLKTLLGGQFDHCCSSLMYQDKKGIRALLLNIIGLQIATSLESLLDFMAGTLFAVQSSSLQADVRELTLNAMQQLLDLGLISHKQVKGVETSSILEVTNLGRATFKGSVDVDRSQDLYRDLCNAQQSLVVANYLHLLYLITPYDMATQVKPDWMIFYYQMSCFDAAETKVASLIGVPESFVARKASGQRSKLKVDENVPSRFYLTLILYDLWKQKSIWEVSSKFRQPRGFIQNLLSSSASFASCVANFCQEMEEFWAYQDLMQNFVRKLSYCVTMELIPLMEITGVKQGRAKQLYNAGYKTLAQVAHASAEDLIRNIEHLNRKQANQIIASAKILIQERAETLREEAEELVKAPVMPETKT